MIDTVLYTHYRTNIFIAQAFDGNFVYGSAEKLNPPYMIMRKIVDPEQPQLQDDEQGDTGEMLLQISAYHGYVESKINSLKTIEYLNAFKEYAKLVRGIIGTTEQYRINYNFTGSVTALGDGVSSLNTWGAFFEQTINWVKV